MQEKKNILVLVDHFGQGGAEKAAGLIAQILQESGLYTVFLFAVHQPSIPITSSLLKTGTLGIEAGTTLFEKIRNYYRKLRRLKALKKRLKIDLTISSLWPVDWINAVTGKDKKIAIIQINILNNDQNKAMVKYKSLVTRIYNQFDKVVLGSSNLFPELTHYFKIREELLETIHNPIDATLIGNNLEAPLLKRLQPVFEKYKILVAANRLHPIKNTTSLVSIFNSLSEKEDARLLIIGEGEEKDLLKETIVAAGLRYSEVEADDFDESASVYLLKFQANIHNIISRSRMFLFPTKGEGLPLALIEALYCGVPVLVSDCPNGGVFEVLQGRGSYNREQERQVPERAGGGYLMPVPLKEKPATLYHWKEKIEEILGAEPELLGAMQRQNRSRALDFDKEIIKQKWLQVIEEITE